MPNCIDAAMNPVESPGGNAVPSTAVANSGRLELADGDDSVLPCRHPSNEDVRLRFVDFPSHVRR
jgi:hypothetical protein